MRIDYLCYQLKMNVEMKMKMAVLGLLSKVLCTKS